MTANNNKINKIKDTTMVKDLVTPATAPEGPAVAGKESDSASSVSVVIAMSSVRVVRVVVDVVGGG